MEIAEYQNMFDHEGKHFYYVSLHDLIIKLINKYSLKKRSIKILDAGCGTGMLLSKIQNLGEVVGVDYNKKAVSLSKKRGLMVKEGSVSKLPYRANSFDVVTCIDVLVCMEIADDEEAIEELYRVLKPKGIAIIRVSANKWLRLAHDKHVHSVRRYDRNELEKKIKKAGFKVVRLSFMNVLLLPVVSFKFIVEKIFPPKKIGSNIGEVNSVINWCGRVILGIENWLLLKTDLPFGLGLIVVAKKN